MAGLYESDALKEICDNVKNMGFGPGQRIRLYGEEFDVVSDPFPEADGIAVNVRRAKNAQTRVLRLPATILRTVKGRIANVA